MRTALTVIALLAAATIAGADTPSVEFGGERYRLGYQDQARLEDGRQGDGLAEFTLPGETVHDWTKLFAYYLFTQSGDDPVLMAEEVGKASKEANPNSNYAVRADKEKGDAIVDFLTWAPGSDVLEFNVFKYARAGYGPGLVALQYAQRFKIDDMGVEAFRALRQRAVAAMAAADVTPARSYFAEKAREVGTAESGGQPAAPAGAAR